MNCFMNIQTGLLGETFQADITFKWSFSGMCPLINENKDRIKYILLDCVV